MPGGDASAPATAAQTLDQASEQLESALDRLEQQVERPPASGNEEMASTEVAELRQALNEIVRRFEDALDLYRVETRRLTDETSRLALVADRLETRLGELTRLLDRDGASVSVDGEPASLEMPRFQPTDAGLEVVISAVPGFQELMDAQRGLSGLPAVEGASVHRFQNGEASLEVMLRSALGAAEAVEGLRQATGHQLVIEEARPEASRLRLRFIGQPDG